MGNVWSRLIVVGVAAIVAFAVMNASRASAQQSPMNFRVARMDAPTCGYKCPEVIVAEGVIEPDTPTTFLEFARSAAASPGLHGVIFLNSPGGNVVASMELGVTFRKLHIAAVVAGFAANGSTSGPVAGECASACVYAFMGATRRVAPRVSRVALHRMSVTLPEDNLRGEAGVVRRRFADPRMVALLENYASRMGVSPDLVRTAESLPPDRIQILSPREIARWRLAVSRL